MFDVDGSAKPKECMNRISDFSADGADMGRRVSEIRAEFRLEARRRERESRKLRLSPLDLQASAGFFHPMGSVFLRLRG
jgi:hypothetical protein